MLFWTRNQNQKIVLCFIFDRNLSAKWTMPSDFVLTDRFALQTHYLSLTGNFFNESWNFTISIQLDSLLTDSTTTSVPSKDFQRIRNNSGLQRNIWRIKKIRQNLQNGQTSSSASISNSTTTTVDKEAEYYERCPKKQVHNFFASFL